MVVEQMNSIRKPAVAGQFYPGDAAELEAFIQGKREERRAEREERRAEREAEPDVDGGDADADGDDTNARHRRLRRFRLRR